MDWTPGELSSDIEDRRGSSGGGGGFGDCSFSTYQQCQATASGRDATCAANPYANAELLPGRGRMSRRKF